MVQTTSQGQMFAQSEVSDGAPWVEPESHATVTWEGAPDRNLEPMQPLIHSSASPGGAYSNDLCAAPSGRKAFVHPIDQKYKGQEGKVRRVASERFIDFLGKLGLFWHLVCRFGAR